MRFVKKITYVMIVCSLLCITSFGSKAMNIDPNSSVMLQAADSDLTYKITPETAYYSGSIKGIIKCCRRGQVIPLPYISHDMLSIYIIPALNALSNDYFGVFKDEVLAHISAMDLVDVINAAYYLDIHELKYAAWKIFQKCYFCKDDFSKETSSTLQHISKPLQLLIAARWLEPYAWIRLKRHTNAVISVLLIPGNNTEHTESVNSVCFSPDGATVASGSNDETVKLWDVVSGQCIKTYEGHGGWVNSVAFSPDGKTVASGSSDKTIRLWDVKYGWCFKALKGHEKAVYSVAFSPDGTTVASGSWDGTIKLWNVSSGECLKTFGGHEGAVWSVCFSPDGKTLASASSDKTLRIWDIASGECIKTLQRDEYDTRSVCFSSDDKIVEAGSLYNAIRIWDVLSGQWIKTCEGHDSGVNSVCFSPDGKTVASGSSDKTIRLWDVTAGYCIKILQGHTHSVRSVCFSPDGTTVVSGSADKTVRLYSKRYSYKLLKQSDNVSYLEQAWFIKKIMKLPEGKQYPIHFQQRSGIIYDSLSTTAQELINERCYFI